MSAQELNIQKQRDILQQRQRDLKQNQQNNTSFMSTPVIPDPRKTILEPQASNESSNKINQTKGIEIKASPNVQEILNRIKQSQSNIGTTDTQEESSTNNDRILSELNVSETKKGRKPKTAPSIYISTK
jgi:predicted transposase YdaD